MSLHFTGALPSCAWRKPGGRSARSPHLRRGRRRRRSAGGQGLQRPHRPAACSTSSPTIRSSPAGCAWPSATSPATACRTSSPARRRHAARDQGLRRHTGVQLRDFFADFDRASIRCSPAASSWRRATSTATVTRTSSSAWASAELPEVKVFDGEGGGAAAGLLRLRSALPGRRLGGGRRCQRRRPGGHHHRGRHVPARQGLQRQQRDGAGQLLRLRSGASSAACGWRRPT